jgi:hypothetical protein
VCVIFLCSNTVFASQPLIYGSFGVILLQFVWPLPSGSPQMSKVPCPLVLYDNDFAVHELHCLIGIDGVQICASLFGALQLLAFVWVLHRFIRRAQAGKVSRSWADCMLLLLYYFPSFCCEAFIIFLYSFSIVLYISQLTFYVLSILWCILLLVDSERFWGLVFALAIISNAPVTNALLTVWYNIPVIWLSLFIHSCSVNC